MRASARRRFVCALALIAVLFMAGDAAAKLDSKAWKAAQEEFEKLFADRGHAKEKVAVLEKIASDGSARAWKLLSEAFELEVGRVEEIRAEYEKAASVHGDILLVSIDGYSVDAENRAKKLQAQMKTLEQVGLEERAALAAVIRLAAAGPSGARKNILKLVKSKTLWPVRAGVARVAGGSIGDKTSLNYVKKVLATEKDRRVRMAALEAMAAAKALPAKAQDMVVARLSDEDSGVVIQAAGVVSKHPFEKAREALQTAWKGASAGTRVALATAIKSVLADESLSKTNAELDAWWQKQDTSPTKSRIATIPLTSDGVLFVIEISRAMKDEIKDSPWLPAPASKDGKASPPPSSGLSGTRFDLAKSELQIAIRRLPKSTHFNILAYNHGATLWERSMRPASVKNKELSYRWLRALKASGSGYVAGALRLAFRMAGTFAVGEKVEFPQVDTLVLISFGKPTDNSFPTHRFMEAEDVLSPVSYWNGEPGLVIHSVCFGKSEFMSQLAARNGGTYIHR